jgi:serine/threonine-protein kinase HipA
MTKRFDRYGNGKKLHMQSLCAMAHYDFNQPASYSYEQALQVMKRLKLSREDIEQQVLRTIFNVIARNQDDHVKNIAFLMNRVGEWKLSPAFDVTYAYDPMGEWTSRHQMSINGKRDSFTRGDLIALAKIAGIKETQANEMIDTVNHAVLDWPMYAEKAGVEEARMEQIQRTLQTNLKH